MATALHRGRGAQAVLAPLAAVVAVVAVIAGVFTAAGFIVRSRPAPGGHPAATTLPRFYVTLSGTPGRVKAVVRDSRTGATLSSVPVPVESGPWPFIAAGNDRTYALAVPGGTTSLEIRFFLLRVSGNGRTEKLSALPVHPISGPAVTGVALSPDGNYLAVSLEGGSIPHANGAIEVASTATGAARIWSSRGQYGYPFDPAWVANGPRLGFGWYNHFTGHNPYPYSQAEVRLLNTSSAAGHTLLTAPVIVPETKALAVIQTALVTPDGHAVIASITRDVPQGYYRGTIVARIARISAVTGRQIAVYRTIRIPYRNNEEKYLAEASCQVVSLGTASGDPLATCKHLGKLVGGAFTPLPGSVLYPLVPAVAW